MWEFFIVLFWGGLLLFDYLRGRWRWDTFQGELAKKENYAKPFRDKYEVTKEEYNAEKDPKILAETKRELEEFLGKPLLGCPDWFISAFYFAKLGKIPPIPSTYQCEYQIVGKSSDIKLLKFYEKILKENGMTYSLAYTFKHLCNGGVGWEYEGIRGYVRDLPDDYSCDGILVAYWEPVEYLICNLRGH